MQAALTWVLALALRAGGPTDLLPIAAAAVAAACVNAAVQPVRFCCAGQPFQTRVGKVVCCSRVREGPAKVDEGVWWEGKGCREHDGDFDDDSGKCDGASARAGERTSMVVAWWCLTVPLRCMRAGQGKKQGTGRGLGGQGWAPRYIQAGNFLSLERYDIFV